MAARGSRSDLQRSSGTVHPGDMREKILPPEAEPVLFAGVSGNVYTGTSRTRHHVNRAGVMPHTDSDM